jgi:hypothetical protein
MIDEVRVGTKEEALWLFGQILGSETLDEELQYNEAGPSSRCEALFAKGTVLQLRHLSLGDYLRDAKFGGTIIAPTMNEARVEIAVITMRVIADDGEAAARRLGYGANSWLHLLRDINIESCDEAQVGNIVDALYGVFDSLQKEVELPFFVAFDLNTPDNRELITKWSERANSTASKFMQPPTRLWVRDVVQNIHLVISRLEEHFVRLWLKEDISRPLGSLTPIVSGYANTARSFERETQPTTLLGMLEQQLTDGSDYIARLKFAIACNFNKHTSEFLDRRKTTLEEKFEDSLRLASTDIEKHQVLVQLARAYCLRDSYGSANEALSKASNLDLGTATSDTELHVAQDSLIVVAEVYGKWYEISSALDFYRKARSPSKRHDWKTMSTMVDLLDSEDHAIMQEIELW